MTGQRAPGQPRLAVACAVVVFAAGFVLLVVAPGRPVDESLFVLLAAIAIVARLVTSEFDSRLFISGAFLCGMLAVGLLGPLPAFAIPVVAESVGWLVERYRRVPLLINLAGMATPTVGAAVVFESLDVGQATVAFPLVLGGLGIAVLLCNIAVVAPLMAILDGAPVRTSVRVPADLAPTIGINVALIAALAALYAQTGTAAMAFALLVVVAFAYMTRLVLVARERTREYANLSWGVLSGLVRALDARDQRAARHSAAVARFSRDIARQAGMSPREQEIAHTAGLLHDIGKFALSDRVMERSGPLTEADWGGVRRHPEIGAGLLRDIGVYGPVADIVRAHHERVDGRGYPNRLRAGEIPPLARIVAVAEVYDTLTAPDTYRTPMSSFEALTELRRVAGTQLDATYVEALASVLAGHGTDYRHAGEADFDRELDIERRVNEAVGP